jgi:ATP-dependent DNA helicase RecG
MFTENANRSQGAGILDLSTFVPFSKNPAISRMFRETALADELGSGMRNTFKYTTLYSNQLPQFIEGDVFRAVVPLTEIATGRVGPQIDVTIHDKTQAKTHDKPYVGTQVNASEIQEKILAYCITPHSKVDIISYCGYSANKSFTRLYIKPLLDSGMLQMTSPDKPKSRNQKYIAFHF